MGSNVSAMDQGNDVLTMFQAIDRGEFVLDLEESIKTVVESVMERMQKGSVTIKLDFQYDPETEAMKVTPKVTSKLPERPKRASLFFITPGGKLSRYDSRQRDLVEDLHAMERQEEVVSQNPITQARDSGTVEAEEVPVGVQQAEAVLSSEDLAKPEITQEVDPATGEIINVRRT